MTRTDSASRLIRASRGRVYRAFLDSEALMSWLPPDGMDGHVDCFEPHDGGTFRFTLTYRAPDRTMPGKSSEDTDIVEGRFLELVADERIVQQFEFDSADPAFAGAMTMTWTFTEVPEGTEVAIRCDGVPEGIRPEDHQAGFRSSLEHLARFVE